MTVTGKARILMFQNTDKKMSVYNMHDAQIDS